MNKPTLLDLQLFWSDLKAKVIASDHKLAYQQDLDDFREQCIAAGAYIRNQRKNLIALTREVGDLIYQITESYPYVVLNPFVSTSDIQETPLTEADQLFQIAQSLDRSEQLTEAEPLYKQAITMYESTVPSDAPKLLECLSELGSLYGELGRGQEMEAIFKRILDALQNRRGVKHPDRAVALNNLAAAHRIQERFVEAEDFYQQAIEIDREVYGENSVDYATGIHNLAELYIMQQRYMEAEPLCRSAVAIFEKELGATHVDTALVIGTYTTLLYLTGQEELALSKIQPVSRLLLHQIRQQYPNLAQELENLQTELQEASAPITTHDKQGGS